MKILNLDNWGEKATEILWDKLVGPEQVVGGHTQGIIASLSGPVRCDKDFLKRFPNLKFIASCTTGLDHIDTDYCKAKGIKIISLQGETDFLRDVYATAEHTWALILSLVRKVPFCHQDIVDNNNWQRENWQGIELYKKTLGIVGYGRVGQQVAEIATMGFDMNVSACDIKSNGFNTLKEVLQESDIIAVHTSLNETSKGLFGIEEFKQMKPTAYFINTSRGQIVVEKDLLWALDNRIIAGAALDVVQNEPNINPRLVEYANNNTNLLLTCHIGGNTVESREKTQVYIARKIKEFIEKQG